MSYALLHFLVGSTGAGKTTHAIDFCEQAGAVRFSIDEWMARLFWMDAPQPIEADWAMARVQRCSEQIWERLHGGILGRADGGGDGGP